MNRELLEKPFSPEQIKQREGNFGRTLDYITGHAVIQRLNDAFDGEWSFTMSKYEILEQTDEVLVVGKLNAGGIVKSQFGSSKITRSRETGEIISLADDLKAAATDALKKAATMLGVGLHLYRESPSRGNRMSNGQRDPYAGGRNNGNGGNGSHSGRGNDNGGNGSKGGNGNGRLSSKQFNYIQSLIQDKGMTRQELNQQCLRAFNCVPEHLTKADASSLIKELLND